MRRGRDSPCPPPGERRTITSAPCSPRCSTRCGHSRRTAPPGSIRFLHNPVDLYPAIDVQGGRLARAPDGARADPLARAREFARAGARWLHVVDLDRAKGRGDNAGLVTALLATPGVRVQLGGALTDPAAIATALAAGAARVVLGPR